MSGIPSVDELVAALIDSWNDGDARRFASLFSESADYVTGQGVRIKGRKGIAELLVSGETDEVRLDERPSIRLHGDAASVVFSWHSGESARRGVILLAATHQRDGWRIDRLQNTDKA